MVVLLRRAGSILMHEREDIFKRGSKGPVTEKVSGLNLFGLVVTWECCSFEWRAVESRC